MTVLGVMGALVVLLALTGVVAGVALLIRRGSRRQHIVNEVIQPHRLGATELGECATLLQFSTEAGARCPDAHRTLAAVAARHAGVSHLDIDLTNRPDIARHFHVMQTPTTLVLDRSGAVQTRFGGAPSRHVVELELARLGVSDKSVAPDGSHR
ncbi:thioredoxin family protein [Microbacterium sp. C7(2022)]|uniref:TlpA family protein disulfide reductase n=1 Tax=Microbacterium sp. C7(2022) TaxID=2992759 RepID=UPI00237C0CE1|nr:thioredoxin family protein [Microbacterium sp. C7(2022)]MDE0547150.1 thioredoxin family protein [Microbacterium sp. C7(2022)]